MRDACLDPAKWREITIHLDQALDLETSEREHWLANLAATEPDVANILRELLDEHQVLKEEGFLSTPPLTAGEMADATKVTMVGRVVGAYTLQRPLGHGGMGEVWLAARSDGRFDGRCAIKFLDSTLAHPRLVERFLREGRLLGRLAHPNIARLSDAGTTDDGRPFLVLEYVDGLRIDQYCDSQQLSIEQRVRLFIDAVSAVVHAHSQLIVHRDLKSTNVFVTREGVVKLLDFGIAKLIGAEQDSIDDAATHIDELVLTPEYAAPEQLLGEIPTTATDVYQLGMLLYVLLTGTHPLPRGGTRAERIKLALEQKIPRASQFAVGPSRKQLRGDLDAILDMALRIEPTERYATAATLREDLFRYINRESVRARKGSALYHARQFVARHRLSVAGMATALMAVIIFGFAMAWLAQRASVARDRASEEAEIAREVIRFTAGLFELANPLSAGTKQVSARELLDTGVRRLQSRAGQQRTDVRAALFESAGNAYRGLGAFAEAESLLTEALQLRRHEMWVERGAYAQALIDLALLKRDQGDFETAATCVREAIRIVAGEVRDVSTLSHATVELAEILRRKSEWIEADKLTQEVLATIAPNGVEARTYAYASLISARVAQAQGHIEKAIELLKRLYQQQLQMTGPLGEFTLEAQSALAEALVVQGRPQSAEPLLRSLVAKTRQIYGDEHANVGIVLNNLANALSDIPSEHEDAARIYMQAAKILQRTKGPMDYEVGNTYNNLGVLYTAMQKWPLAEDAFRRSLEIRRASLGERHPDTISTMNGLGYTLARLERYKEAERMLRSGIAIFDDTIGPEHWRTANAHRQLAFVLMSRGRFDEAQREVEGAYAILEKTFGRDHPRTLAAKRVREQIDAARRAKATAFARYRNSP